MNVNKRIGKFKQVRRRFLSPNVIFVPAAHLMHGDLQWTGEKLGGQAKTE